MPFSLDNMARIAAGANTDKTARYCSLWSFVTPDGTAAVSAAGYFNPAASQLAVGDTINCVFGATGGVAAGGSTYVVTAIAGGVVTVVKTT